MQWKLYGNLARAFPFLSFLAELEFSLDPLVFSNGSEIEIKSCEERDMFVVA